MNLDFEFCCISVKNKKFFCNFHSEFLREMKMKFKEKFSLHGTVKDIWAKSWTLKPNQIKRNSRENTNPELKYHSMTQDMFSVKTLKITK